MFTLTARMLVATAWAAGAALAATAAPPPPAEPKFVFATMTHFSEGDPPRLGPASATVWTLSIDGTRSEAQPLDLALATAEAKRQAARDRVWAVASAGVLSAGPLGGSLVHAFAGEVVEESDSYWPVFYENNGAPSLGWQSRGIQGQRSRLYLVAPGGRVTRIGDWTLAQSNAVWSPDGSSVFVTQLIHVAGVVRVNPPALMPEFTRVTTRVDMATGATRRLALPALTKVVAAGPGGKTLLVTNVKSSHPQPFAEGLSLVTLPGDPDEPLTLRPIGRPVGGAGYRDSGAISPDGTRAVVATTEYVPLPEVSKQRGVTYFSDEVHVRRFQLVDLAAGTLTPLATRPVAVPDFGSEVHWSPDGKRVAFTDADAWEQGPFSPQAVRPHVVTCDPDGKNPRTVPIPAAKQPADPAAYVSGPAFLGWR